MKNIMHFYCLLCIIYINFSPFLFYSISIIAGVAVQISQGSSKQCSGSVTFWYGFRRGSESSDPYLRLTDPARHPAPDPDLFVINFQDTNKK